MAVSIPIFTAQLEKAREATDEANLRAVYAEVMTATLTETANGTTENGVTVAVSNGVVTCTKSYTTKQKVAGWQGEKPTIGNLTLTDAEAPVTTAVTIKASSDGKVEIGTVKNS